MVEFFAAIILIVIGLFVGAMILTGLGIIGVLVMAPIIGIVEYLRNRSNM